MWKTIDERGTRLLRELFIQIPTKETYPEYHQRVRQPMDLQTMAIKVLQRSYNDCGELETDLALMLANVKKLGKP
ncbi:unnamed protein product, partial [Choristocarpus tenellus]